MELEVKNLSYSYRCFPVLDHLDFKLTGGNLVSVLGKNGAGKSTLFRCMLGFLKGYEGDIIINGINRKEMNEHQLAKHIAYIPQNHETAYAFSVKDMVLMGTTSTLKSFQNPGHAQQITAQEALSLLGIESLANRSFAHISGGEQQLVLIARAIAQQAKILIMDEPCSNLDYGNQIRVMETLCKLSQMGYLVIQSTHNPEHAYLYADQAMVLINRKIAALGTPGLVLTEPVLKEMYGIDIPLYQVGNDYNICIPKRMMEERHEYVEAV